MSKAKIIVLQGISCSSKTIIKDFLSGNLNVSELMDTLDEYSKEEHDEIQNNIFKTLMRFNKEFNQFDQVLTTTTRAMRRGEESMVDYRYVNKPAFEKLLKSGQVIEHVYNFGDYYGTLRKDLTKALDSDNNLVAAIDIFGALKYKELFPEKTLIIHMLSDEETMVRRLKIRNSLKDDIDKRVKEASIQTEGLYRADYVIDSRQRIDQVFEILLDILLKNAKTKRD